MFPLVWFVWFVALPGSQDLTLTWFAVLPPLRHLSADPQVAP